MKNQTTKEPFNTAREKLEGKPMVVDQVAARMLASGVAINAWISHFVIAPPLIIEKDEIDAGIAAFDDALSVADALIEG